MDDLPRMNVLKGPAQLHEQASYLGHVKRFSVSLLNRLVQVALWIERHDDERTGVTYFKFQKTENIKVTLNV